MLTGTVQSICISKSEGDAGKVYKTQLPSVQQEEPKKMDGKRKKDGHHSCFPLLAFPQS
jgi:hypothetical protein